jgi:hypothetical protein
MFQDHEPLENHPMLGCFIPHFYTSVCPVADRAGRPEYTFRVRVNRTEDDYAWIYLTDDDDSCHILSKKAGAIEAEEAARWIANLAFIDLGAILQRFQDLGWNLS